MKIIGMSDRDAELWRSGQLTPAPNPLTEYEKNAVVALAEELKGLKVHPLSYLKGTIAAQRAWEARLRLRQGGYDAAVAFVRDAPANISPFKVPDVTFWLQIFRRPEKDTDDPQQRSARQLLSDTFAPAPRKRNRGRQPYDWHVREIASWLLLRYRCFLAVLQAIKRGKPEVIFPREFADDRWLKEKVDWNAWTTLLQEPGHTPASVARLWLHTCCFGLRVDKVGPPSSEKRQEEADRGFKELHDLLRSRRHRRGGPPPKSPIRAD